MTTPRRRRLLFVGCGNGQKIHHVRRGLTLYLLFFSFHSRPLSVLGTSRWSQGIISSLPLFSPCISVSRIRSRLLAPSPRRLSSCHPPFPPCSHPHTCNNKNQMFRTKPKDLWWESNPCFFHPDVVICALYPLGIVFPTMVCVRQVGVRWYCFTSEDDATRACSCIGIMLA